VGDESIRFDGVEKISWRLFVPGLEGFGFWQLIKSVVDFDRIKVFCVILEPSALWQTRGIIQPFPVTVMPARCAYSNVAVGVTHTGYFSTFQNQENFYNLLLPGSGIELWILDRNKLVNG